MWLTFPLFIASLVYYSSLSTQTDSSYHLCVFAVNTHPSHPNTLMCFATTKTLKSLRQSNESHNPSNPSNWDDTCDYLTYDSLETL